MTAKPRYQVLVTNAVGVVHGESLTDSRSQADAYARLAVEDGCPTAVVVLLANAWPVSWWNADELARWKNERRLAE
jgi:hypothetical protein